MTDKHRHGRGDPVRPRARAPGAPPCPLHRRATTCSCSRSPPRSPAVFTAGPHSSVWHAAAWWAGTVAAALLAFTFERLYERDRQQISVSALDEARDFGSTLSFLCFVELLAFHVFGFQPVTTATVGIFWIAALVGLPGRALGLPARARAAPEHAAEHARHRRRPGRADHGPQTAEASRVQPPPRRLPRQRAAPARPGLDDMPVLGREDDLVEAIRRYRVSRVILAFSKQSPDAVLELIREAGLREVTLSIIPRYFEIMTGSAGIADVDGIPVIELPSARLSRFARATKRAFDLGLTLARPRRDLPAPPRDRSGDPPRLARPRLLPPAAARPGGPGLPHHQVQDDGGRRRDDAGGPPRRERVLGAAVQDPRRSARHARRAPAAADLARRAAATPERAAPGT